MTVGEGIQRFIESMIQALLPTTCCLCRTLDQYLICEHCRAFLSPSTTLIECAILPEIVRTLALFPYEDRIKKLLHKIKFEDHKALGQFVGTTIASKNYPSLPKADLVIPVPLDATRRQRRGYNQVNLMMKPLILRHNLGQWCEGCYRFKSTEALHGLSKEERRQEIKNSFWIDPCLSLQGKSIMIVDDIVTTGATLSELAAVLKQHGATSVTGFAFSATALGLENGPVSKRKP